MDKHAIYTIKGNEYWNMMHKKIKIETNSGKSKND